MMEAYKFLHNFKGVKKVKYNGEVLYNILMENYSLVSVNNLVCETLHPENIIAKLYTSNFKEDYKNKIICMINYSIMKQKVPTYKKRFSIYHKG